MAKAAPFCYCIDMPMTNRKINAFLRKHGEKRTFHLFVLDARDDASEHYRGFIQSFTVTQTVETYREIFNLEELQMIGNGLYVRVEKK